MFIVVYLETTEKHREANKHHSEINIANILAYCLAVCILCGIHKCMHINTLLFSLGLCDVIW